MTEKILCVDDEPNVLEAYQRALRKRFDIDTAPGGDEALEAIAERGPYAVVVADMKMPGMNGVQLLARVREVAPDSVRMMLTGNADQQTALDAVNEGQIFRFMTKPCPPPDFAKFLEAGIAQYRLITAERELLSKTVAGSIKMLTDVLAMVKPSAFGRASRVQRLVRQLCRELRVNEAWRVSIAAMLSQVGCVAVPEEILTKVYSGGELSASEKEVFRAHPQAGRDLIGNIPRLEGIAEIVGYQEKLFDGRGFPADYRSGKDIPLGARILKVALDWDALVSDGLGQDMALAEILDRTGCYDPAVVAALARVMEISATHVIREIKLADLAPGMVIARDIRSAGGTLLCARGQEMHPAMLLRLRNYCVNLGLAGPITIFVPVTLTGEAVEDETAIESLLAGESGL